MVIRTITQNRPLVKQLSFFIILLLLLNACTTTPQAPTQERLPFLFPKVEAPSARWNVAFLVMEGVYNTELTAPMDIFQHTIFHHEHGMEVFTVAKDRSPLKTFEGLQIIPDVGYLTDSLPAIDVLVVPSAAHHLDTDLEDSVMIAFVKQTGQSAKYVLSLCDGAFVLAKAGLLDEVASTTFPGDIEKYKKMFPHLKVHEKVLFVHEGKFVTSAGGAKSFEPALYLAELLYGKKAADGIARGMVIDWEVNKVPAVIVP